MTGPGMQGVGIGEVAGAGLCWAGPSVLSPESTQGRAALPSSPVSHRHTLIIVTGSLSSRKGGRTLMGEETDESKEGGIKGLCLPPPLPNTAQAKCRHQDSVPRGDSYSQAPDTQPPPASTLEEGFWKPLLRCI